MRDALLELKLTNCGYRQRKWDQNSFHWMNSILREPSPHTLTHTVVPPLTVTELSLIPRPSRILVGRWGYTELAHGPKHDHIQLPIKQSSTLHIQCHWDVRLLFGTQSSSMFVWRYSSNTPFVSCRCKLIEGYNIMLLLFLCWSLVTNAPVEPFANIISPSLISSSPRNIPGMQCVLPVCTSSSHISQLLPLAYHAAHAMTHMFST